MVAALAMPLMLLISPTGGRSARAADIRAFGTGAFQANSAFVVILSNTGAATLTGSLTTGGGTVTRVRITRATVSKSAVFVNAGVIVNSSGAPAVSATLSFAGTISNQGRITATKRGAATRTARAVVVKAVNSGPAVVYNAGTIKATASASKNGNSAFATGVAAFGTVAGARITVNNLATGKITVKAIANGKTNQDAIAKGIVIGGTAAAASIVGAVTNAGLIKVNATMLAANNATATVRAVGISLTANIATFTGDVGNAGTILVNVMGSGATQRVSGTGIRVNAAKLIGDLTNQGTIAVGVVAVGSNKARANGIAANLVTGGNITNGGLISVMATGSRAAATGIGVGIISGSFINSGTINVVAIATSGRAEAIGFHAGSVSGNISNAANATFKVSALAGTGLANAGGIVVTGKMTGDFKNSGKILVKATGNQVVGALGVASAGAVGFAVSGVLLGNITNVGAIKVSATGSTGDVTIRGISLDRLGTTGNTGKIVNSGKITVAGKLTRDASRLFVTGIRLNNLSGNFTNKGAIKVTASATASNTELNSGSARGFVVSTLMRGSILNSGKITVVGNLGGTAVNLPFQATGIRLGNLVGNFTNKGTVKVTLSGTTGFDRGDGSITARGFVVAGTMMGSILNNGLISVKAISKGANGDTANATGIAIGKLVGNITNKGTINVTAASRDETGVAQGINIGIMTGVFKNSGKITVAATGTENAVGKATGVRFGTLKTAATTAFLNTANARLKVRATATSAIAEAKGLSANKISGDIKNLGKITVVASGVAQGTATGLDLNLLVGNFTNAGTLKVTATAATSTARAEGFNANTVSGTIKNSGKVIVRAVVTELGDEALATGFDIGVLKGTGTLAGKFINAGLISVKATGQTDARATGISIDNILGNFTNTANATLKASAIDGSSEAGARGFVVNGMMTGTIKNLGKITVFAGNTGATQTASAFATGIRIGNLTGNFTNAGTLRVQATAPTASATARGIYISSNLMGNITNNGKISVRATGSNPDATGISVFHNFNGGKFLNAGTLKVTASGTDFSADALGFRVRSGTMAGNITNNGKISVKAVSNATTGANAMATGINVGNLTGNFTNAGILRVTASAPSGTASAVGFFANTVGGSKIRNTGLISVNATGTNVSARGIVVSNSFNGTLNNLGTIKVPNGTGIVFANSVGGDVFNSGLISASRGIEASGNAANVVTNSGTIRAGATTKDAIALGSGDDTVNINGGKITGVIDGETGGDLLNFNLGTGGNFVQNGEFRRFEGIVVNSGNLVLNNDITNNANPINMTVKDGARLSIGQSLAIGDPTNANLFVNSGAAIDLNNRALVVNNTVSITGAAQITAQITGTAGVAGGNIVAGGALNVAASVALALEVNASGFIQNSAVFTIGVGTGGVATLATGAITDDSFILNFTQTGAGGAKLQVLATRTNSFADAVAAAAGTANAGALAGVLETLGASGNQSPDMNTILGALSSFSTATEVSEALVSLLPDFNGGAVFGAVQAANAAGNQVFGQIMASITGGGGDEDENASLDGAGSGVAAGSHRRKSGFWIQGLASFADADRRGGIDGYDADTLGIIAGVDGEMAENFRLGVALAYADTDVDVTGARSGNTLDIESFIPSVYVIYDNGKWFASGQFSVAFNDNDQSRRIAFLGRTATADYDSQQYALGGMLGAKFQISKNMMLAPFISVSYAHLDIDGYTESGAGAANNVVGDQDYDYFAPGIGAALYGQAGMEGEWELHPNFIARVSHDFVDDAVSMTTSLGGETTNFNVDGYDPADTKFNLGLGLDLVHPGDGITVGLSYDADLAEDFVAHNLRVQVRWAF